MSSRIPREIEDAMIAVYLDGATQEEVAAQFGYSRGTCITVLQRRGIKARNPADKLRTLAQARSIPKEHEDAMIVAYVAGATAKEAAAQFGYSDVSCFNVLRRRGIASRSISEAHKISREDRKSTRL